MVDNNVDSFILRIQIGNRLFHELIDKPTLEYPYFTDVQPHHDIYNIKTIVLKENSYENIKQGDTYIICTKSNCALYRFWFSHLWKNEIKRINNLNTSDMQIITSFKVFDTEDNRVSYTNELFTKGNIYEGNKGVIWNQR